MGKRPSLYLREKRDRDIISYIEPLLEEEEFSSVVRSLIRDGIKYRQGVTSVPIRPMPHPVEVRESQTVDFEGVELAKKDTSDEEIKARLDDF